MAAAALAVAVAVVVTVDERESCRICVAKLVAFRTAETAVHNGTALEIVALVETAGTAQVEGDGVAVAGGRAPAPYAVAA